MKYYCIFKGVNTLDLGLYMERYPERSSPSIRVETYTIPGRHGNIHTSDDTYDTYVLQVEFVLKRLNKSDEICKLFKGSGWLIIGDNPERRYKVRVSNTINLTHIIKKLKRFVIEFECQPFAYESTPTIVTKTQPFSLINVGTVKSDPIITAYGTGDINLIVNDKNITLTDITDKIVINSELMDAYNDSISMNNKMSGDFPLLKLGENIISWTGNVTKVEVQPNWRWV